MRLSSLAVAALVAGLTSGAQAEAPALRLAAAPPLQASGFLGKVLPAFERSSGLRVRVDPVLASRALELARAGGADVLLTDSPEAAGLVEAGHAFARREVLRGDLVIVGPYADPASVRDAARATVALVQIANEGSPFVSGGPSSSVFPYERGLWAQAGRDPAAGGASWYREAPPGKPLLEVASEARAYALVERAIWLAFADRRSLDLLVQGDPGLRVSYQVLVASSLKHPGVRSVEGERLADWLTSVAGRAAIESFRLRGAPVYSTPAP